MSWSRMSHVGRVSCLYYDFEVHVLVAFCLRIAGLIPTSTHVRGDRMDELSTPCAVE